MKGNVDFGSGEQDGPDGGSGVGDVDRTRWSLPG